MVKNYVIYKFEKVKVGEIALDDVVKGSLDDALRAMDLLPGHLKDKVTHGDYNHETGNYIVCDPTHRPEMPLVYLEEVRDSSDRRPSGGRSDWTLPA